MRKCYSDTFKAEVVLELFKEEKTVAQIASERHIHPNQIHEWRAIVLKDLATLFSSDHEGEIALRAEYEKRLEELYAEIGRLTTQVNWLKKNLATQLTRSERLWRSVKYEEVYLHDYITPRDARQSLTKYFEFYDHERPHQALAYHTPAQVYFAQT